MRAGGRLVVGTGVQVLGRILCGGGLAAAFLLAAEVAHAEVVNPKPGTIDPRRFTDGSELFRISLPDKYEGPLAICPVCGKPLKDHDNPNFVCQDPNRKTLTLNERQAVCPVCGNKFNALVPEKDLRGGIDHDFCWHPLGILSNVSNVWMCPKCGYAALHENFGRQANKPLKKFVSKTITPGTIEQLRGLVGFRNYKFKDMAFLAQEDVPEFLKYENAVAIARQRGAGHFAVGMIHLGASHAYRRLAGQPPSGLGMDMTMRRIDSMLIDPLIDGDDPALVAIEAQRLLRGPTARDAPDARGVSKIGKLYLLLRLATFHDRLGEAELARAALSEAESVVVELKQEAEQGRKRALADEDAGRADLAIGLCAERIEFIRRRSGHLAREAYHQTRAAAELRQAVAGGEVPAGDVLATVYLVGELLARIGKVEEATPWLQAAGRLAGTAEKSANEEERRRISLWAHYRLENPAFFQPPPGGQGKPERRSPDPNEREFVERVLAALPGGAPPAGEAAAANVDAGGETASVAPAPAPATETASQPARGGGRPASCREQLARIWKAIEAYVAARNEVPSGFDALVKAGLITPEEAGDFRCVDSGSRLYYRRPSPGKDRDFTVFHEDPGTCPCKNILYSDGSVGELGK